MAEKNYFKELYAIDVSGKTEDKNGFTYLSWAYAWGELKSRYPDAFYTIYENADGLNYHTDGKTCWVKTGVTVNGIEHIEYLPVMDYRNRSIPLESVTSCDVNKSIQRSLTKAVARHGLGLYIYAGEDLPDSAANTPAPAPAVPPPAGVHVCSDCGNAIVSSGIRTAQQIVEGTLKNYGRQLCWSCMAREINKQKGAKVNAAETVSG